MGPNCQHSCIVLNSKIIFIISYLPGQDDDYAERKVSYIYGDKCFESVQGTVQIVIGRQIIHFADYIITPAQSVVQKLPISGEIVC